jgi:hypothetical protein
MGGAPRPSSTASHKNRSPRCHTSKPRKRPPGRTLAGNHTYVLQIGCQADDQRPHRSWPAWLRLSPDQARPVAATRRAPGLRRRPLPQAPSSPPRRPHATSSSSPELQLPPAAVSPSRQQASADAEKKQVLPPPAPRGLCPPESTGDSRGGGG